MTTPYRYPYRAEGWEKDIYPMPAFPQLVVSDLARSSAWYQKTLGFADVFTMRTPDGAPMLVHLRWCLFGDLLLSPARQPMPDPAGRGVSLTFAAESADAVAARAQECGVRPADGPVDRPWNARDVTFTDPDGYRLVFTAPTAAMLEKIERGEIESMDDVVERLRKNFVKPA
jgi:catechol 2,3-dioxygenase-like lactoylglutathione lyase family enzyme